MTLCEIVAQAKEGDRFQGDWHKGMSPECYLFMRGSFIWIHLSEDRDKMWDSSSVAVFTADYTFLPPEPKFKVGDTVKIASNTLYEDEVFILSSVGDYDPQYGWLYWCQKPTVKAWESQIELYTGPDTCDRCGQVRPLQNWEAPEPPTEKEDTKQEHELKVGDMARVNCKWHSEHGHIVTIKEIYGGLLSTGPTFIANAVNPKTNVDCVHWARCHLIPYTEPPIEWDGGDLPKWKAFYLTWKMWDWLAENPGKVKSSWPEWTYNDGKVKDANKECFACEYRYCLNSDGETNTYSTCILRELWPKGCESLEAPYRKWREAFGHSKDRSDHAQTIADFAKKKYYEEIGRKK